MNPPRVSSFPSKLTFQLLLAAVILSGVLTFQNKLDAGEIPYQSEWLRGHYQERINYFEKQPLRKGDIVMIGDSLTEQGGSWATLLSDPRVQNRGISGDMTWGVLARLDELKANPPKAVFLLIGINDIFNLYYKQEIQSLASISRNIEEITSTLHQALPDTQLFVQSLLPDHRDFITAMATAVNQRIQAIENKKFTFVDIHSTFVTPQGILNPDLSTDGTHLNVSGYDLWKAQLMPIIEGLE